jgi:hypothetical protein
MFARPTLLLLAILPLGCAAGDPATPARSAAAPAPVASAPVTGEEEPVDPRTAALLRTIEELNASLSAEPQPVDEPSAVLATNVPPQPDVVIEDLLPAADQAAVRVVESNVAPLREPVADPTPVEVVDSSPEPTPLARTPDAEPDWMTRLTSDPASPSAALDRRLLTQIAGEEVGPDWEHALQPSEARAVDEVAEGLEKFRQALVEGKGADGRAAPIVEAAAALRRQAGLTLPTVALCQEVRMFGDYDLAPESYAVGRPHRVVLYVEADGFASEETQAGRWRTKLSLSAILYDPDGRPVMSLPPQDAEDVSRRQRRDFFVSGLLTLPSHTGVGRHTLKITVRDTIAARVAQASVPVEFVRP